MLNNIAVKKWLSQFDRIDLGLAKSFLSYLTLVSNDEFEDKLFYLLDELKNKLKSNRRLALVPINDKEKSSDDGKRYQYNSADRVGQYLTNIERNDEKHFVNSPTMNCIRSERIDHIVLVDDFIGSGTRVINYCKNKLDRSIKSWLSYKYCKLWIVVYAATSQGISNIYANLKYLSPGSLKYHTKFNKPLYANNEILLSFLKEYGEKTDRPDIPLGYKDVGSSIIFQHGCPNTTPSILWANDREWKALFPNQAIQPEFVECFGRKPSLLKKSEILWQINQKKLALRLLEAEDLYKLEKDDFLLITVLCLIQKKCSLESIATILLESEGQIKTTIKRAEKYGLLRNQVITEYGRDLIHKVKLFKEKTSKIVKFNTKLIGNYYPEKLNGFQRKSSV